MALTTNNLQVYYNPKSGIKTGNKLDNIAPGGIVKQMSIVGGTTLANGAIHVDGVDDYLSATLGETMWTTPNSAFTMELVFTPRIFDNADRFLVDSGGVFMGTFSWADLYWEMYRANATYTAGQATTNAAMNAQNVLNLTVAHNGGTSSLIYINGTQIANQTTGPTCFSAQRPALTLFNAVLGNYYKADFHAFRLYNRQLSAAEITDNRNMGIELGVTVGTPQVKIAEFRAQSGEVIPIYSLTGHEATEAFRFFVEGEKAFIPLVLTTDPLASRIRMQTSKGLRAWKK